MTETEQNEQISFEWTKLSRAWLKVNYNELLSRHQRGFMVVRSSVVIQLLEVLNIDDTYRRNDLERRFR